MMWSNGQWLWTILEIVCGCTRCTCIVCSTLWMQFNILLGWINRERRSDTRGYAPISTQHEFNTSDLIRFNIRFWFCQASLIRYSMYIVHTMYRNYYCYYCSIFIPTGWNLNVHFFGWINTMAQRSLSSSPMNGLFAQPIILWIFYSISGHILVAFRFKIDNENANE